MSRNRARIPLVWALQLRPKLRDYWIVVKDQSFLLLTLAAAAVLLAYFFSSIGPPRYEASITLNAARSDAVSASYIRTQVRVLESVLPSRAYRVERQGQTSLIRVSFADPSPELAGAVVREVARAYMPRAAVLGPVQVSSPRTGADALNNCALAFLAAIGAGLLAILLFQSVDVQIRRFEDLINLTGAEVLCLLPSGKQRDTEAMRRLSRSVLAAGRPGVALKVMVASPLAGEGRSTVAAQLMQACATLGRKTLLFNADLRRRELTEAQLESALEQADSEYELIILDSAPLLEYRHAIDLARAADMIVLVARRNLTTQSAVLIAWRYLRRLHCPVLGFAFED